MVEPNVANDPMTVAWRDFLNFAVGSGELVAAFTAETGIKWPPPPKNGLEAQIDKATGIHERLVRDFAFWVTLSYWGNEGVPANFLEDARLRFPPLTSAEGDSHMDDWLARKQERIQHYDRYVRGWKLRTCTACSGSGRYDNTGSPKCGACGGTGKERYRAEEPARP